jgi:hypothetical protein
LEIVAAPAPWSRAVGTEAAATEAATTRELINNADDFRAMAISLEDRFAFACRVLSLRCQVMALAERDTHPHYDQTTPTAVSQLTYGRN